MHFANNPPSKAPVIHTGTRFRRSHGPVSVATISCKLAVRPHVNVAPSGGHRSQLPPRAVAFFWAPPLWPSTCSALELLVRQADRAAGSGWNANRERSVRRRSAAGKASASFRKILVSEASTNLFDNHNVI